MPTDKKMLATLTILGTQKTYTIMVNPFNKNKDMFYYGVMVACRVLSGLEIHQMTRETPVPKVFTGSCWFIVQLGMNICGSNYTRAKYLTSPVPFPVLF